MSLLILVVEDDPDVAALLAMVLEHGGYTVRLASTLAEAHRALADSSPPALVLLDVVLPDGDGLTLCPAIHRRWPHLPVLVVTARPDPATRAAAAAAGCPDVIPKPFDPDELLVQVQASIGPP